MTFKTINDWSRVAGSSYKGSIDASYDDLKRIFGKHAGGTMDGKVRAEWIVEIAGVVVTIYDYKDSTPVTKYRDWHVGSKSSDAVQLLDIVLKENM